MRAAGILVFCLFSSILSTVTSLTCLKCVSLQNDCEGDVTRERCRKNQVFCSTQLINTTLYQSSVSLLVKGCATRLECLRGGDLFSITTVNQKTETIITSCCQSNLCNEKPLPFENYEEPEPNGLKCPGCFAVDADSCVANETVACLGKEDQCLAISSTTVADFFPFDNFTEKSSYQGCTTKNSCAFPLGESEIAGGVIQFNITSLECRNASSSEPHHQ